MTALSILPDAPQETDAAFLRRLLAANDATQALQIAVDHVVEALGCAVSWAGLIEGEYLVMGAHAGLISTEMSSAWRLKVGEGIGGRVAAERRPYMSRDYRHDSRRVPLMKRLIDNEGIQATLVVPLLMGDEALGVLYAAQRRPYPWAEAEQQVLDRIGQDLAIRLRQLDVDGRREERVRVAELKYERTLGAQRECAVLAGSLAAQEDSGAALDLLALKVGGLVELRNRDGRLLRSAGDVGDGNPRVVWRRELQGTGGLTISVVDVVDLDEVAAATVELATGLFRLQFLRLREHERTVEQLHGEMLDQLLTGRIADPDSFRQRLLTMGFSADEGQVVVVGSKRGDVGRDSQLADVLAGAFAGCTTGVRSGRLVALVEPGPDVRARLESVLARVPYRDLVAGLGRPCQDLGDYAMSYDQARAACELGLRGTGRSSVLTAHDLGIVPLASVPLGHLRTMVRDTLGPLLDADDQRGTDLVETLHAYLSNDRHLPATASALHVHYNTVRNRIARIEELLDVDVRDVEHRYRLETALRMHALTRAFSEVDEDVTA
ncbi:helix-turn-helix domain-containing protein [Actinomadura madurae]|uniref:helix-turn-helix domain-containing protein n=1 Tax=Actinomadura madurae TaxID=1993 RepID=UPI0020262746|nr:helix-turn-helix domain-containing protein [Actinomadura madurae]URM96836.1 helix-turn-helix domain-containing protein [Actinomadura madurae]URN07528.1 helix-turn-helix domain-containing protein [Actinomadura madurae]